MPVAECCRRDQYRQELAAAGGEHVLVPSRPVLVI
jgi:hypothetical protein